jgi:hypothetical protein
MVLLDASAPSLSLSQTNSHIHFRDRNSALLRLDIADCWLRKEYLVLVIITKKEQVVTHRIAILFQLVCSLLFTDQYVYFCVSNCNLELDAHSAVCEESFSLSVQ